MVSLYFAYKPDTKKIVKTALGALRCKIAVDNNLIKENEFRPISVIKKGQKPINGEDYVDGISGGTITSKGVSDMLNDCLMPYKAFLENLKNK